MAMFCHRRDCVVSKFNLRNYGAVIGLFNGLISYTP